MGNIWRAFKDERLPENYFRITTIILRHLGIELTKKETTLYKIYSIIFLLTIVIGFTCTEIYELWVQRNNLEVCLTLLTYLVTHLTGIIKTGLLYWNRRKIGDIIRSLRKAPFAPDECRDAKEEHRLIRTVIRNTETLLTMYFSMMFGTMFAGIYIVVYGRLTKESEDWVFPYGTTLSIMDFSYSPMYELGCVLQMIAVVSYGFIIATTYVFLSSIMAHISVQLKIVANSFRDVRKRAKAMQALDKTDSRSEDFFMNIAFRNSYFHHLKVMELNDEMERLCSVMVLTVFVTSVALLCFTLYVVSLYPVGSAPFIQNLCLWFVICCHTSMYCYWGNEVSLEAENVALAVAEADWVGAPKSIRSGIIMVIGRSQRPLVITAGKFVPLSLATMMSIVKGSLSYFMVLRQTQDKSLGV